MRFVVIGLLLSTTNVAYPVKSHDELFPCKEVLDIPCSSKSSSKHVKISADTLNQKSALLNPSKSIAPIKIEHPRPTRLSLLDQDDSDWRDWMFLIGMGTLIICTKVICYQGMISSKTCDSIFDV